MNHERTQLEAAVVEEELVAYLDGELEAAEQVRVERRLADGTVRVYFDDRREPVMVAEDRTFGAGWVGFGSFDDTGKVDNLRIWAPNEAESRKIPFFRRLPGP